MKHIFVVLLLASFCIGKTVAQNTPKVYVFPAYIDGKDTMPLITLKTCIIIGYKPNTSKKEINRYTKLWNNILKVYPYARLAAQKLEEYDKILAKIPDTKEQKRLMKVAEKELQRDFSKELENLTFSQGIILLKLVDRETSRTTYQIVDELRGSFRAFFYQAIARLFKYDLKAKYDPNGKDREIEKIVRIIEEDYSQWAAK